MIYTRVLTRGALGARSPADGLPKPGPHQERLRNDELTVSRPTSGSAKDAWGPAWSRGAIMRAIKHLGRSRSLVTRPP